MAEIKLLNGIIINKIEERIREYCRVEIYHGYDNCHEVNNKITLGNINAANRLFARIGKTVTEKIFKSENIIKDLELIDNREIGVISEEEWENYKERLHNLLFSFCIIKGVGIAVATKILHLKRPKLIPILDSFVVKFLLGIDTQNVWDKKYLSEIGIRSIDMIREDIRRNLEAFTRLQEKLSDLPITLSTVRLYDILVWSTEKWDIRKDLKAPFGVPYESISEKIYKINYNYKLKTHKELNDMIWVNVDIPTQKCTIHADPGCTYAIKKSETPFKGVGKLKRDGGWLSFSSNTDAKNYCKTNHPNYSLNMHC